MRSFIIYTLLGTLATFSVLVYLSLLPHFEKFPRFINGFTPGALLEQWCAFFMTLALSWILWWSVSWLLSLVLYSLGRATWIILFLLSLAAITGITFAII